MRWRLLRAPIEREDDVVAVRQRARLLADRLGLSRQEQTGLATAVSEIARNAFGYAGGGTADFGVDEVGGRQSFVVRVTDRGPGIAALAAILDGRYVSSTGMGLGIVGARRLAHGFDIRSVPGQGTVVALSMRLPAGRPALDGPQVAALSDALRQERDTDPQQAVRAQNLDLLQSLSDLAEREEETRRLNAELRDAKATLERKVAERTAELAQANELLRAEAAAREGIEGALRQAQKMEAVGQLTGGIAHDFNNLLTGITGSLDLLQTRLRQGRHEHLDRYVETAVTSATRAAALTHRLLAFSRPHALAPEATDVGAVVRGMEELLRRTVPADVELRVETAPDLWTTLCDGHQLENAVLNLCINARDAMADGGTLSVEATNERLDAGHVARHPGASVGDHVRLRVTDTGTGMSPEVLARVFEPFFTTKPIGKGTGLGLAMIYGFARQSNGHCHIESVVGTGTAISLLLPRLQVPSEAGPPSAIPGPVFEARTGTASTILLVERHASVRGITEEVLDDLGHRVTTVADGAEALGMVTSGTTVDLIVTDLVLAGGMSGRRLVDEARTVLPEVRVLFLTGLADKAEAAASAAGPRVRILPKPFHVGELVEQVNSLLDER